MAQAWFLKSRPSQVPARDSFELRSISLPPVQGDMVHVRNTWFSVDPYMRARMNDVRSYIAPFSLDAPLDGLAVGEVIAAPGGAFAPGDLVTHRFGWRDEVVADASAFTKIRETDLPPALYLNTLGMIGATAYFGLTGVAKAVAGETLFVSAAAGAVGSLVVQIAKLKGMRVVASAGGPEKCSYVLGLGADAAIDYKTGGALSDKLRQAAPDGIDVYFDNVGGEHLDAAMGNARDHARFAICGMIDMYNAETPVQLRNLFKVISARLHIQGFIVSDFRDDFDAFERDMRLWVREGKVVSRETVMNGLESAPDAFLGLFAGKNLGKMLVRL